MLSQSDQNLDPPPPCLHLYDFENPSPSNVQNFTSAPTHPLQKQ